MTHFAYLAGLLIGIGGLLIIDWRARLAFWADARRTLVTVFPAMAVFILWDFAGIDAGVFFHGNSRFSLPFTVVPQLPLEELFFLFLLCYSALLLYRGAKMVKW